MAKHKKQKDYKEIYEKFLDVPKDKKERLEYIYKKLKVTDKDLLKLKESIDKIKKFKRKNKQILNLTFYIVPEGIARPRKGKYGFYVPNINKFYNCMNDYLELHKELYDLKIISECKLDLQEYLPIPSDMNKIEKLLAELKYIKPIKKPDWDNLGKGSDMLQRIMLDDSIVVDGRVRKYYSFKPRIEVRIVYYSSYTNSYHKKYIMKMIGGIIDE